MRKILLPLVAIGALAAMVASAQPIQQCTMSHDVGITGCPTAGACVFDPPTAAGYNALCGLCCVMDAVHTVTDWIFFVLIAVVALLVIWGGFTIATAGGAPDKVAAGRNYILFSMIGLALALLSRAIPALVRALIS